LNRAFCHPHIAAALLSFVSAMGAAEPIRLAPGQTLTGHAESGASVSYEVQLNAGDFIAIRLDHPSAPLNCKVFDDKGEWLRTFSGPAQTALNVVIAGDGAGTYRLEAASADPRSAVNFSVGILMTLPLSQRAFPAVPLDSTILSPWLRTNADRIANGALTEEAFWQQPAAQGMPLIEPASPGGDLVLVTFLWRGGPDTRNVLVDWFPFALARPNDYAMARLGSSGIWYRTLSVRRNARFIYQLVPNDPFTIDQVGSGIRLASAQADPLNPRRLMPPDDTSRFDAQSIAEMPDAPRPPWLTSHSGTPAGAIDQQEFRSELLRNTRKIFVYTPAGYPARGRSYPVVFLTDGADYLSRLSGEAILNNLIHEQKIPALIAVLIDNVDGKRTEELSCNPKFAEFLRTELLPWARRHYPISRRASETAVGGFSLGGLNATCTAARYPNQFGGVLSQSGSYWWTKDTLPQPADPSVEPNQVAQVFESRPRLPLRFFLTAGAYEVDPTGYGVDVLLNNRVLRDVLLAKGYPVIYEMFFGGHDYQSWDWTFGDGLMALFGKPQGARSEHSRR
jgi:enterochelin esterase-like enzyme